MVLGRGVKKLDLVDVLLLAALVGLAIVWVAPIVWVIGLAFKPNDVLMRTTGGVFAPPFTTKNFTDILATSAVFGWMLNSFIVSIGQTFLTLAISTLAGYGFARTDGTGDWKAIGPAEPLRTRRLAQGVRVVALRVDGHPVAVATPVEFAGAWPPRLEVELADAAARWRVSTGVDGGVAGPYVVPR